MVKQTKKFMRLSKIVTFLTISSLFLASCSDPTLVGAGLLDQDQADVGFTDTLSIRATAIARDSIRTYTPFTSSQLATYLLGNFNDPVLGRSSSSIYGQIYPENSSPDFEGAVLDSVVLVLPYEISNFYGKLEGEEFGLEVFEIMEFLVESSEFYSNQELAVGTVPLGSVQATISLDTLAFIDYDDGDPDTLSFPHLRVPLSAELGQRLIGLDSAVYENDSLFLDAFRGLYLRPSTENAGMLSLDLLSENAGIYLYYSENDGGPQRFLYDFDIGPTVRFTHFEHDYSGAKVEPYIGNSDLGDSLLFVQGMSGLEIKLEIPNLDAFKGAVVNKAEIEVFVANLQEDEPAAYPPVEQLIITAPNSQGQLVAIDDIEIILAQRLSLSGLFGGVPEEGTNGAPVRYTMNISTHLQEVLEGTVENELYILPFRKAETASRTVLYGAKHPQYGVRLKLAFTKL